jgi:hypothetical protein
MRRKSRELTQPKVGVSVCESSRPTSGPTFDYHIIPQKRDHDRSTSEDDGTGDYHVAEEL